MSLPKKSTYREELHQTLLANVSECLSCVSLCLSLFPPARVSGCSWLSCVHLLAFVVSARFSFAVCVCDWACLLACLCKSVSVIVEKKRNQ